MPSFNQFVLGLNKNYTKDKSFEELAEEKISPLILEENEEETHNASLDAELSQVESSLLSSEYDAEEYSIEHDIEVADIVLDNQGSPYNLLYGIVSQVDGSFLDDARVELFIKDNSKLKLASSFYTNNQGQYLFHGLSNGDYQVKISKHGYSTSTSPLITLRGNQYMVQNLTVAEDYTSSITLSGVITDEETGAPIESALVALYSVIEGIEVLIKTTEVNAQGIYSFINLQPGEYFIRAGFFRREEQNA